VLAARLTLTIFSKKLGKKTVNRTRKSEKFLSEAKKLAGNYIGELFYNGKAVGK
jgi:hypothetical protein